mgnify:CR=1 FL=1
MKILTIEEIERLINAQDFEIPKGYKELYKNFERENIIALIKLLNSKKFFRIELARKIFDYDNTDITKLNVDVSYCKNIEFIKDPFMYSINCLLPNEEIVIINGQDLDIYIDYSYNEQFLYSSFAFSI